MSINTEIYNYSYSAYIGSSLRAPLFQLATNILVAAASKPWESTALKVIKIGFHAIVALIFVIPAAVAWCIGKAFTALSSTVLDHDGLCLAPPPIEIAEAPPNTQISTLYDRFVALQIDRKEVRGGTTSKRDCLRRLCQWVSQKHTDIYPDDLRKRNLFCTQVSRALKGIVAKIESGEVSADKERDLLTELAEAATRCYPTWLEVAEKLYAEVHNGSETVQVKLLRCIQECKETAILEFAQNDADAHWHALNYVRNILGQELGLGNRNSLDPYAGHDDPVFSKNITKWLFLERYDNTNHLVSSVQTMIHSRKYDACYHDFLVQIAKERDVPNPEDFVGETFFEGDDCKITFAGVNLMLRSMGVLR